MTEARDDARDTDMRRLVLGLRIGREAPKSEWLNVEARGLRFRLRVKSAHGGQARVLIEATDEVVVAREAAVETPAKGVTR